MTKASDNEFPSVLFEEQASTPTTPAAGFDRLFFDSSDGKLKYVDEDGTVTEVGTGGGGGGTPTFSGARVTHSVDQLDLPSLAVIAFDTEVYDTDAYHDNATNNTRLTVPSDGFYAVGAHLRVSGGSSGYRGIFLKVNGLTANRNAINAVHSVSPGVLAHTELELTSGDYVEVEIVHNTGSSDVDVVVAAGGPFFYIHRIGT